MIPAGAISDQSPLVGAWPAVLRAMIEAVPPWARTGLVCVLDLKPLLGGFFDESGIQDGARYCVLAGFVGSMRQWLSFEEQWGRILTRFGVAEFHAKEFFGNAPPYTKWTQDQKRDLLEGLTGVITAHRVTPVGAVVDVVEFNRHTHGERRLLTGGLIGRDGRGSLYWLTSGAPSRPYFIGFMACIAQAVKLANPGKVVEFFFDQQAHFAPLAIQLFIEAKALLVPEEIKKLGGCGFYSRTDANPLQAADLLAHCWYSYCQSEDTLRGRRRDALEKLADVVKGFPIYNREGFEVTLRVVPDEEREFIRRDTGQNDKGDG